MTHLTELAAARLPNDGDLLIILAAADGIPASVVVHWPSKQPTAIAPEHFREVAATMVQLFSDANSALTRVRGRL